MKSSHRINYNSSIDFFSDFTSAESSEISLGGRLSKSLSYGKVKSILFETERQMQLDNIIQKQKYTVAATMRIERFFTGLMDESTSTSLIEHASEILDNQEYINFFMTCGPNYVRSVHRAKEVTAIFTFEAYDHFQAQTFANAIKLYVYGNRGKFMTRDHQRFNAHHDDSDNLTGFQMDFDFDDNLIKKSLSIEMLAFGLGLNHNGTETLVATNIDDFNQVMRFAFDSMTKSSTNDENSQAGMLYGIEVVPWADHAGFMRMVDIDYNKIKIPTPSGLIEKSFTNGPLKCSSPSLNADDYGKCCKPHEIVKEAQMDELGRTVQKKRCLPTTFLSPVTMKENLETNAEFVAWINKVAREKVKKLSDLGQCVHHLRALPERYDYYFLQASNNAKYDDSIDLEFTVMELKAALDPAANLSIIKMISDENDEYFEMFYKPCLSALYGLNLSTDKDTDPKYFMAQPWFNIAECVRPSCLEPNMSWDRMNGGGCVNGLLGRDSAVNPIPLYGDPYCAKKYDVMSGQERCKYGYRPLANTVMQMDNCRDTLPQGKDGRGRAIGLSMDYLLEYFCMPQIAVNIDPANALKMDEVDNSWDVCVSLYFRAKYFLVHERVLINIVSF